MLGRWITIGMGTLMLSIGATILAWAEKVEPRIYAINLEHRLNTAGTGGYNHLLDAIRSQGLDFELSILPLKRWYYRTKTEVDGCFFPVSVNAMETYDPAYKKARFVVSEPIDRITLHVFTAPSRPLITHLSQLEGMRVAAWKSNDSSPYIDTLKVYVDESRDESSQLKMLYAGRLDAIIGFAPDVPIAAERLQLPPPHYDENLALLRDEGASLVCHDTAKNQLLINQFNRALIGLKKSGELNALLGKHASVAI